MYLLKHEVFIGTVLYFQLISDACKIGANNGMSIICIAFCPASINNTCHFFIYIEQQCLFQTVTEQNELIN